MTHQEEKTKADEILEELKSHGKILEDLKKVSPETQTTESPNFENYLVSHVPDCPECKKVLEKSGYIKKPQEEVPKETPKEPKKWRVSDIGRKE